MGNTLKIIAKPLLIAAGSIVSWEGLKFGFRKIRGRKVTAKVEVEKAAA